MMNLIFYIFFFSSRRRHTRYIGDWSSDVCSSDLALPHAPARRSRHDAAARRRGGDRWRDGAWPSGDPRAVAPEAPLSEIGRASGREREGNPGGGGTRRTKKI